MIGNDEGISLEQTDLTLPPDPTSYTVPMVTLPSTSNLIIGNTIESNSNGVSLCFSSGYSSDSNVSGNTFYLNNFINNKIQVSSLGQPSPQNSSQLIMGENSWDNGAKGNYWSDYNGIDENHDGIGDSSYLAYANNIDYYPLIAPFDIATLTT